MAAVIVLSKTRSALVAFLTAANVGCDRIYDEKSAGDKAAPNVSCGAANAVEDPPGTGNFWVDAVVSVKTPGAVDVGQAESDPKNSSESLCAAVFLALEVDDLAAQLTDIQDDFTVMGIAGEKGHHLEQDGDCWVESIAVRLYCCASDFSE